MKPVDIASDPDRIAVLRGDINVRHAGSHDALLIYVKDTPKAIGLISCRVPAREPEEVATIWAARVALAHPAECTHAGAIMTTA